MKFLASTWKIQRKVISSFLSRKKLNDYMKTNVKLVLQTIIDIKKELENGEEVDVEDVIGNNSFDVTMGLQFY